MINLKKRIIKYLSPYKKKYIIALFLIIISALIQSFSPYINKIIIDDVFGEHNFSLLKTIIIIIVCAVIFLGISQTVRDVFIAYVSEQMEILLKKKLLLHLRSLPYRYIENQSSGGLLTLFQSDITLFVSFYSLVLPMALQIICQIIISAYLLYTINWKITILGFILVPLSIIATLLFSKPIKQQANIYQNNIAKTTEKIQESILGSKEIIAFSRVDWDIKRLNPIFNNSLNIKKKFIFISSVSSNINLIIYWATFAMLILYGSHMVRNQIISVGSLIASVTYFMSLVGPIHQLLILYSEMQKSLGGAKRLFSVLDYKEAEEREERFPNDVANVCSISTHNLCFSRDNKTHELNNINFEANLGEIVAICGESGTGKTTFIKLLLGLYKPTKGTIKIGGLDLSSWRMNCLREKVSVVFQENFFFSETVYNNIKFGNLSSSEIEINNVGKLTNIDKFIQKMPDKYNSFLSENANNLSGGQKQRLAIARALIKNPQILILDEPSSSLDPNSQAQLWELLNSIKENRIIIIISHRPEFIENVDKKYHIKNGSFYLEKVLQTQ